MPNIEEHIRKALAEGKFDDLPGKGQPLRLDENPHEDPEWRLAFHLLRESGYSLPWIETVKEIEADIESARQDLRRAWTWRQTAQQENQAPGFVAIEWKRAVETFQNKLAALNKRIRDYNLEAPNPRFQRPFLQLEQELKRAAQED